MTTDSITQNRLKELLSYDPDTGLFVWAKVMRGVRIGSIAGTVTNGYIHIMIDRKAHGAHRLAFLYLNGVFPKDAVDHINHNRSDNRWANLREATTVDNGRNKTLFRSNTSGCMGVYWDKSRNKWRVQIGMYGRKIYLGRFNDKSDAIKARRSAEVEYGYHPNHGT